MCMEYTDKNDSFHNLSTVAVQRNHKDTVFRLLFREMYPFVFAFELNLYEHQSTVNPNIPLRDLFYVSMQLQAMVTERQLYSSKKVKIPVPRFIVFYNGKRDMPERMEYRLSDLYAKAVECPELELKVTVYNINPGKNEDLMQGCRLLKEYMLFTTQIRENSKVMPLDASVHKAVDDCIREGILAEFLSKQRSEVIAMCIFEYDEEAHMQLIREESREEAWEEAWEESRRENGFYIYHELIKEGFSEERALEIAKITRQEMLEMRSRFSGEEA